MTSKAQDAGKPRAADVDALVGSGRLGRFEVRGLLGRGAFGVVLLGRDPALDRTVALKVLPAARDRRQRAFLEQFLREARSAARLDHPNAVSVFETGLADGHAFIAMEHVPGGNVAEYVREHGPLPARRAAALGIEAARALAHAHEMGVLHQDVKPTNLLLSRRGHAKLADFGLARIAGDGFTPPWAVAGTPAYLAPEAARGEPTEASDLFSLAATIGFLLTGAPPTGASSHREAMQVGDGIEPVDLAAACPEAPRALVELLRRGLARDPAARPADGRAFARGLREAVAPAGPVAARRVGPLAATAAALAIAALGAGLWALGPAAAPGTVPLAAPPADAPLRVGRDAATLTALAYAGGAGPAEVGGRVSGLEAGDDRWWMTLGEGADALTLELAPAAVEALSGGRPHGLVGSLVVARGELAVGEGGRVVMTGAGNLRRVETGPLGPADRTGLELLGALGETAEVQGRVAGHRRAGEDAVELVFDEGDLRLRYERRLFGAMTRKFGGRLGDGIVGRRITVRGTPGAGAAGPIIEIASTTDVEAADAPPDLEE